MFDLPEGTWAEQRDGPYSYFEMEIGTPESKSFALVYGERSKDSRRTTLQGTYKVLANKGDPHFSWSIEQVSVSGRGPRQATLDGFEVKEGDKLSGHLAWTDNGATLTLFDSKSQVILTRELVGQ